MDLYFYFLPAELPGCRRTTCSRLSLPRLCCSSSVRASAIPAPLTSSSVSLGTPGSSSSVFGRVKRRRFTTPAAAFLLRFLSTTQTSSESASTFSASKTSPGSGYTVHVSGMDGTEPQIRQKSEFVPRHGGEMGEQAAAESR